MKVETLPMVKNKSDLKNWLEKNIIQVSWRLSKISVSAQKKHVSATECTGSGLKEVHKSKGAIYIHIYVYMGIPYENVIVKLQFSSWAIAIDPF